MDILHDLDRSLRSANTLAGIFAAMDTALQHYLDTDTRKQAHEALTRQAPPMNSAMALALHIYAASRLLEGMNPLGNDDRRRHQRMLETLRYRSEMERSVLWKRLVPAKLSPRSMGMLLRVMGPGVFFDKGIERFLPRNELRRALMLPFQIGEQEAERILNTMLLERYCPKLKAQMDAVGLCNDGRKENILTWVVSQMGTAPHAVIPMVELGLG